MDLERRHLQAAAVLVGVGLGAATAGCSGSRMDKAGGSRAAAKPLVLALATHDDDYAHGSFAAAVTKLSGGSMRIRIVTNWRRSGDRAEIGYERGIVSDVRSGKVPLGIVGTRVWDTMGVRAFRALLAPFLIDSLNLEGRAIDTAFGRGALGSVSRRGVVGVALLPGPLRRPFGFTRALVRPGDYDGATIGIRPGGVAKATFAALGASARGFLTSDVSGLDGAELDLRVISADVLDKRSRPLTGNVVLWPKAQTIIMNREAFAQLTAEQREILRRAGRSALAPELRRDADADRNLGSLLCSDGTLPVATATPADRAALRKAVEPVYRSLERDAATRAWIAQIRRMRHAASTGTDEVQCP